MGLIINHNLSALSTHRTLGISNAGMAKSIEKLSSGYKINVGADDPSGLIISEQLRAQISGLERAVRNSSEASNLIGIAEGALNEMNELLKKMRALAIHAANNGITSPEQIAADQAEMDSGIQTLERIANTTRYSDQYLLNGQKQLVYDVDTIINDTGDHQLLNTEMTRVDQVFKREGVKMSITYAGEKSEWQANSSTSAQRAFLEADPAYSFSQVKKGKLTANQEFILTGTKGSRLFSFSAGENLTEVVNGINNVKDSTGIAASLIFGSDVRIDKSVVGGTAPDYTTVPPTPSVGLSGFNLGPAAGQYVYASGEVQIYGANLNDPTKAKITNFTITPDAAEAFRVGYNCDGDGKIYAKVIDKSTNSIEYYKDKECTMLIGSGTDQFFASTNNSRIPSYPQHYLDGIYMELDPNYAEDMDVYEIALVGQEMNNQKDFYVDGFAGWADVNNSIMSGVDLGFNTSTDGELFFKYTPVTFVPGTTTVATFKVEAFTSNKMDPTSLVATSGEVPASVATAGYENRLGQTVRMESVTMDNGQDSNLNITVNIPLPGTDTLPTGIQTSNISFTNVGMRIYTEEYGSQETLRIQNKTGSLLYYYRSPDSLERIMVEPSTTTQLQGQDARIGLNGSPVYTTGLIANLATPDFAGMLQFNSGKLGLTSLAVAGHEAGSLYSRASALQAIEENENYISRDRRYVEPRSLLYNDPTNAASAMASVVDRNNTQVGIYLDFSQLDPSVEAAMSTDGILHNVSCGYDGGPPAFLRITAPGALFNGGADRVVDVPIDHSDLVNGFYITDPALKGLYIKTNAAIDTTKSTAVTGNLEVASFSGDNLTEVGTWATNPRSNTGERMSNFQGGMQFQLGNTEGDQDRTIYSIQSMAMANVGRIEYEGRQYCLQDVLGGGVASLTRDPIMSMRIISQAIDDVSTLRARLGAFQKNMLETNINALNVAVENITKTEAAIRDTDMASESTEFTKNQIMVSAGTSMLAQANQVTQNVLQLLQ